MTLSEYRDVVRRRIDDNSSLVSTTFTDSEVNFAINWARNELNKRIRVYRKQYFIYPEQYIDEYDLPSDYLQAIDIIDSDDLVKIFNTEMPRAMMLNDTISTLFYNQFHIDETRQKLIFLENPDDDKIESTYTIGTHDNTNDNITLTATDSGLTLAQDIADWTDMKGYGKMMWSVTLNCDLVNGSATVNLNAGETDNTGILNSNNGCEVTYTVNGTSYSTTLLNVNSGTQFELADAVIAPTMSNITLTFTVPDEQVGYSAIVDTAGDQSYYTVYTPRTDLYYTGNDYNYSGGTFKFSTYIMFYIGITPDLTNDTDNDRLPKDIGGLIPILACHYLYLYISDPQGAQFEMQMYTEELNNILHKVKKEESRLSNESKSRNRYLDITYYNKR